MQQILVFLLTFWTNWLVDEAIPEAWFKKFKAVLSAIKIVFVLAFISAITLFFLTLEPSLTLLIKIVSLPTSLKAALQKSNPAIIPFWFAIIWTLAFLFLKLIKFVVISPPGLRSSSRAFLTTDLI